MSAFEIFLVISPLLFAPASAQEEASVLIATAARGIQVLSLASPAVRTIANTQSIGAVATDVRQARVYWSDYTSSYYSTAIYRANFDGTAVENVYAYGDRAAIHAMAYDWIGQNLYFAGQKTDSKMYVCSTNGTFECAVLEVYLLDQPAGLAVHPELGLMFWTNSAYGEIVRASMDGTSSYPNVMGQRTPRSIVVDYEYSRLYWVDYYKDLIESSDFNGKEVYTVRSISSPGWGIDLSGDRGLYWGTYGSIGDIYRCNLTRSCEEEEFVYSPSTSVLGLKLRHSSRQPIQGTDARLNPCASAPCSHFCVLNPNSFTCLCPKGMAIIGDGRTYRK